MSQHKHIIEVAPTESIEAQQNGEVLIVRGFQCPSCGGKGFNYPCEEHRLNEPCRLCNGRGKIMARVVIGWVPEETEVKA